jgi:hypothetical protein
MMGHAPTDTKAEQIPFDQGRILLHTQFFKAAVLA